MKIKVLHTIPDLHIGGVANLILLLLEEFEDSNYEHHLCYFGKDETLLARFSCLNVTIHKIEHLGKWSLFNTIFKFNELIKSNNFDIIHSHLMLDRAIAGLCYLLNKVPIITTIHTTNIATNHSRFYSRLKLHMEDFLGKLTTTKFVAISKTVKEISIKYRGIPENKITIIYSGIKIKDYKSRSYNNRPFKIISVGRFIQSKGFLDLIEIVEILKIKGKGVQLALVGDGPLYQLLKKTVEEKGLEDNIRFTGFIQNVSDYLEYSDAYITATKEEGFSISTVEALSNSLPVVAYDIPIFRELSNNGKEFIIVPLNDKIHFADKIIELMENVDKYLLYSENGYIKANEEFNIKDTAIGYLHLYHKTALNSNR